MPSYLNALLESIDPSRTLDVTTARANEALNRFPLPSSSVETMGDFQGYIARLYCHVENYVLNLHNHRDTDHWMDWGRAAHAFNALYGRDGELTAFRIARSGVEGGLYAVGKEIAQYIADSYTENEIRARVSTYMNRMSPDEWLEAAEEYVEDWGHLLPAELKESNAVDVKINLFKVLAEHPKMIRRLRLMGR